MPPFYISPYLCAIPAPSAFGEKQPLAATAYVSKKFKCSALGVTGCLVGTFAGLFILPLGLVFGPMLGAMPGELLSGAGGWAALRGSRSAFIGFVGTLLVKFGVVALCVYWFLATLPQQS